MCEDEPFKIRIKDIRKLGLKFPIKSEKIMIKVEDKYTKYCDYLNRIEDMIGSYKCKDWESIEKEEIQQNIDFLFKE